MAIVVWIGGWIEIDIWIAVFAAVYIAQVVFTYVIAISAYLTPVVRFRTVIFTPFVGFEEVTGWVVDLIVCWVWICIVISLWLCITITLVFLHDWGVGVVWMRRFQNWSGFFVLIWMWNCIFEVEVK